DSYVGEDATLENLTAGIGESDVVIISTHGVFNNAHPNESYLQLHDGRWTMADMLGSPSLAKSPVVILSACEIGAIAPTLDELDASGIPGALISAGAASVLASLWPVEDVSAGYIMERFVTYLSYPGYRPAAALFRAVRDARRLEKQAALDYCYDLLEDMERNGLADTQPEQYMMLNNLVEWIEDTDLEHPFANAQAWGGIVIVGSGWSREAGAMVGPASDAIAAIENRLERDRARSLIAEGHFAEARKVLEKLLTQVSYGRERANTLDALAWAVWRGQRKGTEQSARREALELLAEAEFLASADRDDQLLRNIRATRQKIEL
ncbi:MAG: CHAT domain-containing protein, partial [Ardenticatenaceae bacterium]